MDIQEIFSARLKRERIRVGMTMAEFSQELGISLSSLEEYEGGRRIPRLDTLELIAKRLGVPLTELLLEDGMTDASTSAHLDMLSLQISSLEEPARCIGEEALNVIRGAFSLSEKLREVEARKEPETGREGEYLYTLLTMEDPAQRRNTYGLLVKEYREDRWVNVAAASPFCTDRDKALQIVERCGALQLSPVHMLDVVMDCLNGDLLPNDPEEEGRPAPQV